MEPTRESACIDLIFSNDQDRVRGTLVREPMANCDHNMVSFEAFFQKTRPKSKTMVYNFARGGPQCFELTGWLQIQNIQKEDEGVYTCLAKNEFGEVSASARLQVVERGMSDALGRRPLSTK
ncbi:KAZD1 protein, partial [Amia calva]|nr:KAZD1 protein [Amia calva]